jgi:hypothetical protein
MTQADSSQHPHYLGSPIAISITPIMLSVVHVTIPSWDYPHPPEAQALAAREVNQGRKLLPGNLDGNSTWPCDCVDLDLEIWRARETTKEPPLERRRHSFRSRRRQAQSTAPSGPRKARADCWNEPSHGKTDSVTLRRGDFGRNDAACVAE